MLTKTALLGIPLTLMLAVPAFAQTAPTGTQTPPRHGPAKGLWERALPGDPGHMKGKLLSRRGEDLFLVEARVVRPDPKRRGGRLVGTARILKGPEKGKKLPFRGKWHGTKPGDGDFSGKILSRKKGGTAKRRPVIALKGQFHDKTGPPGRFKGTWKDVS
jgi:hypothetical protein